MSPQLISIYALVLMFVVATILPVNMGVLAFVGAFLIGTLVAGQTTSTIIAGFPGGLFLTLVGITFLFAIAQNNGTIDWLVRLAVRAVRGRIVAIPWIMFGISAVLTAVGAVSPGAVAIIAPIALGFALKYEHQPAADGTDGHPRGAGRGLLADQHLRRHHEPDRREGGPAAQRDRNVPGELRRQLRRGGVALLRTRRPQAPPSERHRGACSRSTSRTSRSARPQSGPQVFGDSEAEAISEEIALETGQKPNRSIMANLSDEAPMKDGSLYQIALAGLVILAVLVLAFNLDIGFVAITIGLALSLMAPNLQKRAMGQVAWPEIMLITGVSTYVVVLEKMGTISFVGDSVAGLASPMLAALLLCFIGAVVSAFASSTAVLGSLIPLAVPFLQAGTGVSAVGFIAAMAVSSTIVDVSPFSTNGALVLANAQGVDREAFFRKLMAYGALVTVVAPIAVWALFVVL